LFSLLTHSTAQVAASATGADSQCMMLPPTARLAEDRRRRETRTFWREMPRKWRERAARMPPQPRITDSRYSAWRAEVGRLFTWPVFSRYTYVCIYVCMYTHIYKAEVGRLFTWPGFSRYTYVCMYIRMYTHIYKAEGGKISPGLYVYI